MQKCRSKIVMCDGMSYIYMIFKLVLIYIYIYNKKCFVHTMHYPPFLLSELSWKFPSPFPSHHVKTVSTDIPLKTCSFHTFISFIISLNSTNLHTYFSDSIYYSRCFLMIIFKVLIYTKVAFIYLTKKSVFLSSYFITIY